MKDNKEFINDVIFIKEMIKKFRRYRLYLLS